MSAPFDTGLLRAARAEFAEKILPVLPQDLRYTGAMLKRSLDVLLAQAQTDRAPDAELEDAGFGTVEALARALRSRTIQDSAALRAALRTHVCRKLQSTNPRFLAEALAENEEERL